MSGYTFGQEPEKIDSTTNILHDLKGLEKYDHDAYITLFMCDIDVDTAKRDLHALMNERSDLVRELDALKPVELEKRYEAAKAAYQQYRAKQPIHERLAMQHEEGYVLGESARLPRDTFMRTMADFYEGKLRPQPKPKPEPEIPMQNEQEQPKPQLSHDDDYDIER